MGVVLPVFTGVHGMQTDPPVDQMPPGFVRRILDGLPTHAFAPTQARGGWGYATGTITNSAYDYTWMTWCPFSSGIKIVVSGERDLAHVTTLNGSTTGTLIATIAKSLAAGTAPWFHRTAAGGLLIIPSVSSGGVDPVRKWDGTAAIANLGGTPPSADRGASWGDYLILAGDSGVTPALKNRIWFSGAGTPEVWPALNSVDFPEDVVAVVPKGNTIFVFGAKGLHLLIGDTPPPGGNQTQRKYAFSQGLSDWRGVTTYKDFIVWANGNGVWKSDGGQPIDLTQNGGLSSLWPFVYDPGASDGITLSVYRRFLFIAVRTSAGAFKRCLLYDMEENTWWEWANVNTAHLLVIPPFGASADRILSLTNRRIIDLTQGFDADSSSDADGNVPQMRIVTGAYRFGSYGYKRLRRGYTSYWTGATGLLQVFASTDLDTDPASTPDADPPSAVLVATLGAGTPALSIPREPFFVNVKAEMIRYLLIASRARVYSLEQEIAPYDKLRAADPLA